jgi:formylglycine-generating enzyme required for sulfatase activity/tRNA A-37 threonylcarbamoyl transferase component Bud32
MTYCLNPDCSQPDNPDTNQYCHGCGSSLAQSSQSYKFRIRYQIVKLLGQGGFGRTYLAKDLDLYEQPRVIKKLIAPYYGQALEQVKELFAREAQQLQKLNHPQIPTLHAYFEQNKSLYLVQDFIEGEDLSHEFQREGCFSEEKVLQILSDVLPILQYVHSEKVLHRDIKPNNIMRRRSDGRLFLIDFGGAKIVRESTMMTPGSVIYTPGYAAIEHIQGKPKTTSDIYSLAATSVRLLTGCLPFVNIKDEVYDEDDACWLWKEYLSKKGRKINHPHLSSVLDKMLATKAKDRYQLADEVLEALNPYSTPISNQPIPVATISSVPTKKTQPDPITPKNPVIKVNKKTNKTTLTVISRGEFFKISGYLVGGVVVSVLGRYIWDSYSSEKPTPESSSSPVKQPSSKSSSELSNFSFSVVTVDVSGKIINTQNKSAQYLTVDLANNIGLDLVLIPSGEFTMGSPQGEKGRDDDEGPQHQVKLQSFLMGKYPVTQAQWRAVMGNDPSYFNGDNLPVEQVSWNDCNNFCQQISQKTGKEFRLPSEAEWEYACRAGTTTPFYFGETITTELANYNGEYIYQNESKGVYRQETTEVGQFSPNSFGLYDLHGNVWEWCADDYYNNYQGAPSDGSVWLKNNSNSVLRGGSWYYNPDYCRSANRDNGNAERDKRNNNVGFRLVVSAPGLS